MSDKRDVAADIKLAEEHRSYWRACREEMVHPLGDLVASLPDYLARTEAAESRVGELEAERDYLLCRSMEAGSCKFNDTDRDVGRSSNAMVCHAFGGPEPSRDSYPLDPIDLAACYRARNSAPPHLWPKMDALLPKYETAVTERYPNAVRLVIERTGGLKGADKVFEVIADNVQFLDKAKEDAPDA